MRVMVRLDHFENYFQSILSDWRSAFRQLRKSPGFAVAAILTLVLGIGSTTAIFSVINGVLLSAYPYKNAERLATFTVFWAEQFRAWRFPAAALSISKSRTRPSSLAKSGACRKSILLRSPSYLSRTLHRRSRLRSSGWPSISPRPIDRFEVRIGFRFFRLSPIGYSNLRPRVWLHMTD
jgi:hypothetical protein